MNSTTTCIIYPATKDTLETHNCSTIYGGFSNGEMVITTFLFFILLLLSFKALHNFVHGVIIRQ